MKNSCNLRFSLIFAILAACNANAIVIRHDIEDKQYIELGKKYADSVAYIGGCAATLIALDWVLTAAHCVEGKEKSLNFTRHLEKQYRVDKIIVHPKFVRSHDEVYDVALVQLKDTISSGKPAYLYQDDQELNKPVIFVGRGTYGNGQDGLIRDDFKQRGATNTVGSVTEHVVGFTFNSPETATKLEGISSRGDSGGPAFIELNQQLYVIGVSSYQVGKGFGEGHYGVGEYYTRISSVYPWLKEVIEQTPAAQIAQHPIIEAVKNSDLKALSSLLNNEVLNNTQVLHEAFYQSVMLNRIDAARALINAGADVKKISINNQSLIEFALHQKQKPYVNMLQKITAKVSDLHPQQSPVLALYIDRFRNDSNLLEGVKQLMSQGANIDAQTASGDTALIIAGWQTKNTALVEILIAAGANLDIPNNNGDTALMDAAYLGKLDNLNALLKAGANTQLKNKRGRTALDLANMKAHSNVVAAFEKADKN